ncbi:hypothetical protein GCM10023176_15090 [Micromonospora coerulea]|uniref:Uncharacterized protein n=1 Tax=Micromonospora coerulea TaxID=47856 RepID=A0ABP8SE46_9ACTN
MAGAVVLAVAAVFVVFKVQRDREWARGGDAMKMNVELRLADHDNFEVTLAALGVPAHESNGRSPDGAQTVVAKVTWTGSPSDDGRLHLIALDKRMSPPRLLSGGGGWTPLDLHWNRSGLLGSSWTSSYNKVLAKHYDWLAGLVPTRLPDGSYSVPYTLSPAVNLPASKSGTATVWFTPQQGSPQLTDPSQDIIIALFYVQEGDQVRWAKRISG